MSLNRKSPKRRPLSVAKATRGGPHLEGSVNLDAYCARIGYHGPLIPSGEVLNALHRRHVAAIPFENLDVLAGIPIALDPIALEHKLVHGRRGGYCFEQNGLFAEVLQLLGFRVKRLLAHVRWEASADDPSQPTHLVLHVEAAGGEYLADVGFGSMTLVEPLPFKTDHVQGTTLEPRRLIRRHRTYVHQARIGRAWRDVFEFELREASTSGIDRANLMTSTDPESRFRRHLIAAVTRADCRHTLFDRTFSTRHADGRVVKREVDSPAELLDVLTGTLGLRSPPAAVTAAFPFAWPAARPEAATHVEASGNS